MDNTVRSRISTRPRQHIKTTRTYITPLGTVWYCIVQYHTTTYIWASVYKTTTIDFGIRSQTRNTQFSCQTSYLIWYISPENIEIELQAGRLPPNLREKIAKLRGDAQLDIGSRANIGGRGAEHIYLSHLLRVGWPPAADIGGSGLASVCLGGEGCVSRITDT